MKFTLADLNVDFKRRSILSIDLEFGFIDILASSTQILLNKFEFCILEGPCVDFIKTVIFDWRETWFFRDFRCQEHEFINDQFICVGDYTVIVYS